ncbi:uncharacterized protein [Populus alba]|uniref:uncharacterized protein n=1 Tax=Populus alba TaxID=43335 RepID=UPI003CC7705D
MDSSQPAAFSSSAAAPVVPPPSLQFSSSAAGQLSSLASIMQWPQHTNIGHALLNPDNPLLNPDNAPLLPSSSAEITAASASAVAIVSLSHTHQVISMKLTNTNYLYWRMQMKPYLLGQGVFGFVDGSNSCPSPHIPAADGATLQVSQSFLRWKQQDQLILSALLSSLSMEVLHLVVDCPTSCSVWLTLEQALASTSNSRIMQLHGSLQELRQGDDSVTQFLQKAKTLFDELAAAGRPISLTDFNLYIFRGLRGEFKDLVTSLITRADPLPYAYLLSHLLTHEFIHKTSHLSMGSAANANQPLLPTPPSALLSQRCNSAQFGRHRGRGSWRSPSHRGNRNNSYRSDFRNPPTNYNSAPPYGTENRHSSWQGNWQRRGSNSRCQLCNNYGHTAPQCSQLQQRSHGPQHSANLAFNNSASAAEWFPDTGANQHVTPDLATLTASEPYNGNDNLHVGDVYLINRMPTSVLDNRSPFDCLFQRPSHLGYRCFDIESHRMYISRHVRFHENVFPFDKSEQIAQVPSQTHTPSPITILPNLNLSPLFTAQNPSPPASASALPLLPTQAPQPPYFPCRSPHASLSNHIVAAPGCSSVFPVLQHGVLAHSGRSSGSSSAPLFSATNSASADSASAASSPLTAASSPDSSPGLNLVVDLSAYPLHHDTSVMPPPPASQPVLNRHPMILRSRQPKHAHMVSSAASAASTAAISRVLLSPSSEPVAFSDADKYVAWHDAMCDEIKALRSNHTWSLVPFHPSMNVVGSRWVYRIKRRIDGSIERYKARLVARGFTQQEGIDYSETFSPVIKQATVRLVFSIAVSRNWKIHQLHKSLYGLKQAPRAWYTRLSDFLLSIGFLASKVDTSLFILSDGTNIFYLLVYVDDILLTGSNSAMLHHLVQLLSSEFKLRDLGDVHYFLGIEVQSTDFHWAAVKRILRYLKGTASHGFHITRGTSFALHGFTDADWQRTVARSSTEAEYKALADGTAEVIWLQYLLRDLQHVEVDYHFVCDRVAKKEIQIRFIPSQDQLADVFTKPLSAASFTAFRFKLRVDPPPSA